MWENKVGRPLYEKISADKKVNTRMTGAELAGTGAFGGTYCLSNIR